MRSVFAGNTTAGIEADVGGQVGVDSTAVTGNNVGLQNSGTMSVSNSEVSFNTTWSPPVQLHVVVVWSTSGSSATPRPAPLRPSAQPPPITASSNGRPSSPVKSFSKRWTAWINRKRTSRVMFGEGFYGGSLFAPKQEVRNMLLQDRIIGICRNDARTFRTIGAGSMRRRHGLGCRGVGDKRSA